jgi:hypothetical protein
MESRALKWYFYMHVSGSVLPKSQMWKQPICPLIDEWISKPWYTHAWEYHLALRNEIQIHGTIWMNLKM